MKTFTKLKLLTKGYNTEAIKTIASIEGITDDLASAIADKGISLEEIQTLLAEESNNESVEAESDEGKKVQMGTNEDKKVQNGTDEPDYKALYEAERAKVESLQKSNTAQTLGEHKEEKQKSDYEIVEDLFRTRL